MAINFEDKQIKAILNKIASFCSSKERSAFEVRTKLSGFGVEEHEEFIAWLIEENFLNEERFAIAYAADKFRFNQWGKIKIKMMLKQHDLDNDLIRNALHKIDMVAYHEALKKMLKQKQASIKDKPILNQKLAMMRFALSRGFEAEQIRLIMNDIFKKK
jgi:regulatory protein